MALLPRWSGHGCGLPRSGAMTMGKVVSSRGSSTEVWQLRAVCCLNSPKLREYFLQSSWRGDSWRVSISTSITPPSSYHIQQTQDWYSNLTQCEMHTQILSLFLNVFYSFFSSLISGLFKNHSLHLVFFCHVKQLTGQAVPTGIEPSSKAVKATGVLTTGPPPNLFCSLGKANPTSYVFCLLVFCLVFHDIYFFCKVQDSYLYRMS